MILNQPRTDMTSGPVVQTGWDDEKRSRVSGWACTVLVLATVVVGLWVMASRGDRYAARAAVEQATAGADHAASQGFSLPPLVWAGLVVLAIGGCIGFTVGRYYQGWIGGRNFRRAQWRIIREGVPR